MPTLCCCLSPQQGERATAEGPLPLFDSNHSIQCSAGLHLGSALTSPHPLPFGEHLRLYTEFSFLSKLTYPTVLPSLGGLPSKDLMTSREAERCQRSLFSPWQFCPRLGLKQIIHPWQVGGCRQLGALRCKHAQSMQLHLEQHHLEIGLKAPHRGFASSFQVRSSYEESRTPQDCGRDEKLQAFCCLDVVSW